LACTIDSQWRKLAEFPVGREQLLAFLKRKWATEHEYRLIKELWAFTGNRNAVRFAYEWHNDNHEWLRSYGNENWEFDEHGLMRQRYAWDYRKYCADERFEAAQTNAFGFGYWSVERWR
jgi:uncharacterized protein